MNITHCLSKQYEDGRKGGWRVGLTNARVWHELTIQKNYKFTRERMTK